MKYFCLLAAMVLSACSSSGTDRLVIAARDQILGRNAPAEPSTPLTRARIEALGLSLVRVEVEDTAQSHVMVASQLRPSGVTYLGPDQKTLVLRGGLVSVTHGLGYDMPAPAITRDDPVAVPRPLSQWPRSFKRGYRLDAPGISPHELNATCSITIGPAEKIEIVGKRHNVRKVAETCRADGQTSFENTYMVAPETGFVWKSLQWSGPLQGHLQYEVLEPLE